MTIAAPLSIQKNIWFTVLVACIILCGGLIMMSHVAPIKKDIIATGFLADIVITFPLAYYFLLIRPLKLKRWSILLVVSCCLAVAYFILPAHQQYYIIQLRKLTICIELGILIYCFTKIKKIIAAYRHLQAEFPDNLYLLRQSMTSVLGNGIAIRLMASELSILRFGLFCWKKQKPSSLAIARYSVYKESAYVAMFSIVLFACLVELTGLHLLINHYSKTAAVIVSVLTVYGIIVIVGDLAAIVKSPILIMQDKIILRTGIRWMAVINRDNIASVVKIRNGFEADINVFQGGVIKSSVNILFTFAKPVNIERLYQKTLTVKQIIMTVDQADELIEQLS